ncbi:NAD(P)-dependent oxidoreductase [Pseudoroseicyclus sp. CXY001]|uniref:NAD(P)-dependent oxidoreductase n=1 Tax=Pseudoroseicyclus sp. CXY001 TaxID=3242492 RepID=UPI00358DC0E7
MTSKIGFIGIGRMGAPMVRHLLDAGHKVLAYDPNADAVAAIAKDGATPAHTIADVAAADIVLMSLPTPDVVEAVTLGAEGIAASGRPSAVVDLSTTGPTVSRRVGAGLAKAGIGFVDSPVSGGVGGAEKGTLTLMTACPADLFAKVEPILSRFGSVTHVGEEPGQAQLIKVINNLMSVTSLAIAAEGIVLAEKCGVSGETLMNIVNKGSGRSNASEDKIPKYVLTRSFDFGFALGLSAKDIRLCLAESEAAGVPMVLGNATKLLLNMAQTQLGPNADMTEIFKTIERAATPDRAA